MDGQINQQHSSYRQGLVLGLTMAEIMVLLVFCLLIAMATYLRAEQSKLADAKKELEQQQAQNERNQAIVDALRQNPALFEKLASATGGDAAAVDQFWRDLVESKAEAAKLRKDIASLQETAAVMMTLQKNGIDLEKAFRDAEIVAAIQRVMPGAEESMPSPQAVAELVAKGSTTAASGETGHQWPPIITLSEAGGFYFKTGSAELSATFRDALLTTTPDEILRYIKKYDVNVIEVVGHTDEQAFGGRQSLAAAGAPIAPLPPARQSNLDRDLAIVLKSGSGIARLTPVDNAGLGLARAVSVVSALRLSPKLSGYKMIPLSGAQLVNTDETLALSGTGGDVAQRRRIEIRLRKSAAHEPVASALPSPPVPVAPPSNRVQQKSPQRVTPQLRQPAFPPAN
jgi:outer membrane protein OmpA-like peptidoglycan-associated protein